MSGDPRATIASEPMHFRQTLAIALIVLCVGVDGFDVFSIAFASPIIAEAWHIAPATLGVVLSMELIGMGVGACLLGAFADRLGRRPAVLAALAIAASGMAAASFSTSLAMLGVVRLYTGLGIGGLLVAGSAIISETANDRRRDAAVALMVAGYPFGVALGGSVAARLLEETNRWQAVFELGAIATAMLIVPVALLLPESVSYLCERPTRTSLKRVNAVLALYGRAPVASVSPAPPSGDAHGGIRAPMPRLVALLTFAFFMHMMTFYFLMKWIPKLLVDEGHTASAAGMVVVWANVAGTVGSLVMSLLTQHYRVNLLAMAAMACGSLGVLAFGQSFGSASGLSTAAIAASFFTTGATAAFYALVARAFPTRVRAGHAGIVFGLGRAGAAAGPIAAGLLFSCGLAPSSVAAILACGSLAACAAVGSLGSLHRRESDPSPSPRE